MTHVLSNVASVVMIFGACIVIISTIGPNLPNIIRALKG